MGERARDARSTHLADGPGVDLDVPPDVGSKLGAGDDLEGALIGDVELVGGAGDGEDVMSAATGVSLIHPPK